MAVEVTQAARPFTYDDLEAMSDDGYRREIIEGTLFVTPAPNGAHQRVGGKLYARLLAGETPETMAMQAPYDWRVPDGGSVQPDLMVIRRRDFDPNGPLPQTAQPLLVVEVLSPSNRAQDRLLKRDLYERLGVPAYWIVDPLEPSIVSLRLADGRYEVEYEGAGSFRTGWPFPLEVELADLAR